MLETCGRCGTRFAVGLPACPHCWAPVAEPGGDGGDGDGDEDEEADMAKITKRGVTFESGHEPDGLAMTREILADPDALTEIAAARAEIAAGDVVEIAQPVVTPEPPAPAEAPSAPQPPPAPPLPPKAGA